MHMTENDGRRWGVGELARASGVTVRALHHYEAIGLLRPLERTDGGYRVYGAAQVERLYRIRSLRQVGLSLAQVRAALDGDRDVLEATVRRHLDAVERQELVIAQLRRRLGRLLDACARSQAPSPDQLLDTLEVMTVGNATAQRTTPILVYEDVQAAHDFLVATFGLLPGGVERDAGGVVRHARVFASEESELWLHPVSPEYGLGSPKQVRLASHGVMVLVDDVDAHHEHCVTSGVRIAYAPTDQPYGLREYGAFDLEGGHWYFASPCSDDIGGAS